MSLRHLARGQSLPALVPGKLRLYSMIFCPYAQRTRMVLAHKNIPHEIVNVNLKRKPRWLFERNPSGLVPVLEHDGKILYESAVCDEYLDDLYPYNKLLPEDIFERARQKLLMETFNQVAGLYYKVGRTQEEKVVEDFRRKLDFFEHSLTSQYFGGDRVGMTDFHIWPWFERLEILNSVKGFQILAVSRFPRLNAWMERMCTVPAVRTTAIQPKDHITFFMTLASGQEPNYDALLTESKI